MKNIIFFYSTSHNKNLGKSIFQYWSCLLQIQKFIKTVFYSHWKIKQYIEENIIGASKMRNNFWYFPVMFLVFGVGSLLLDWFLYLFINYCNSNICCIRMMSDNYMGSNNEKKRQSNIKAWYIKVKSRDKKRHLLLSQS